MGRNLNWESTMNWLRALAVLPVAAMATAGRADATQQPAAPLACEVTALVTSVPAVDQEGLPFPRGRWYVNPDRTIWAGIGWDGHALRAGGRGHNVLWIRPAGANLAVTARRLDGDASPMRALLGAAVADRYVPSQVQFPTPGCWEIIATTGANRLTFVALVESLPPQLPQRTR